MGEFTGFCLILLFAVMFAALISQPNSGKSRQIRPTRVTGIVDGKCKTCGDNCGQCGSSH